MVAHKGGAEKTVEYKFQSIIGNGRTVQSELDKATTLQEVEQIKSKMQSIIASDKVLDKQGRITLTGATDRRVEDAKIRVSPVRNKKEMVAFIKSQIGVDITKYIEPNAGHPRSYLGIHLKDMPKNEQIRLKNLMQKKGVRIGENGGLGSTLHYIK